MLHLLTPHLTLFCCNQKLNVDQIRHVQLIEFFFPNKILTFWKPGKNLTVEVILQDIYVICPSF